MITQVVTFTVKAFESLNFSNKTLIPPPPRICKATPNNTLPIIKSLILISLPLRGSHFMELELLCEDSLLDDELCG